MPNDIHPEDRELFKSLEDLAGLGDRAHFRAKIGNVLGGLHGKGGRLLKYLLFIAVVGLIGAGVYFGGYGTVRDFVVTKFHAWTTSAPAVPKKEQQIAYGRDLTSVYLIGTYRGRRFVSYPSTLQTAFVFGRLLPRRFFSMFPAESGLQISYAIGLRGKPLDRFGEYVLNLGDVQRALLLDVNEVLNKVTNRRQQLDKLVAEFSRLLDVTKEDEQLVIQEVDTLTPQVSEARTAKIDAQKVYGDSIKTLQPEASAQALATVVKRQQEEIDLQSRLAAFTQLKKYYVTADAKLTARVHDLKLNYEALLKGVVVFDVKGSDLNIIMYEGGKPAEQTLVPGQTSGGFINFGGVGGDTMIDGSGSVGGKTGGRTYSFTEGL